jgi:hypothetical protein
MGFGLGLEASIPLQLLRLTSACLSAPAECMHSRANHCMFRCTCVRVSILVCLDVRVYVCVYASMSKHVSWGESERRERESARARA